MIVCASLAACNKSVPEQDTNKVADSHAKVQKTAQAQNPQELGFDPSKEPDYSVQIRPGAPVLSPETIATVLPQAIKGVKRSPLTKYTAEEGNFRVNYASCYYDFGKNGMLTLTITDFGPGAEVADNQIYNMLPTEKGMKSTRLSYPAARGYMMWNETEIRGIINILCFNRLTVRIDAVNLDKKYQPLTQYIDLVNLEQIKNLVK